MKRFFKYQTDEDEEDDVFTIGSQTQEVIARDVEPHEADLLAAAPDLLEACELLNGGYCLKGVTGYEENREKVKKALRKAKGLKNDQ